MKEKTIQKHSLTAGILLYLTLASLPFTGKAQVVIGRPGGNAALKNPETVIGQVFYHFSYVRDTTQPANPSIEIMELDYSKNYSQFISQTRQTSDSLANKELKRQIESQADPMNIKIDMSNFQEKGSTEKIFTVAPAEKAGNTIDIRRGFSSYLIKDEGKAINWNIEDSTKTIGSYLCQKATGTSHGRHYTAWFTTDLPYGFGPRRLNGLPGLILEAYDDKKEVVYTFDHLNLHPASMEIGLPESGIETTLKEYNAMINARRSGSGGNIITGSAGFSASTGAPKSDAGTSAPTIKSISITKGTPGKNMPVTNNPIDLTKE